MRNEDGNQPTPADDSPGSGLDSAFRTPRSEFATEPATSFKWVIVAGVTVWVLGAAMIVWARFFSG